MPAFTLIEGTEAVGATEWSLATDTSFDSGDAQTTDGYLHVLLDLADMVAGDQLRIRIYEKARAADAQRIVHEAFLTGAQSQLWLAPPVPVVYGWDVSCLTLAGGTITVNWSLRLAPMS